MRTNPAARQPEGRHERGRRRQCAEARRERHNSPVQIPGFCDFCRNQDWETLTGLKTLWSSLPKFAVSSPVGSGFFVSGYSLGEPHKYRTRGAKPLFNSLDEFAPFAKKLLRIASADRLTAPAMDSTGAGGVFPGAQGAMVMDRVAVPLPPGLVAVRLAVKLPAEPGVPERSPLVALRVRLGGRPVAL